MFTVLSGKPVEIVREACVRARASQWTNLDSIAREHAGGSCRWCRPEKMPGFGGVQPSGVLNSTSWEDENDPGKLGVDGENGSQEGCQVGLEAERSSSADYNHPPAFWCV